MMPRRLSAYMLPSLTRCASPEDKVTMRRPILK
jgi:hypothetical protein